VTDSKAAPVNVLLALASRETFREPLSGTTLMKRTLALLVLAFFPHAESRSAAAQVIAKRNLGAFCMKILGIAADGFDGEC
jgi:hypothetical protein